MTRRGRHFLQIPGPTNTPDRVLRAMAAPTIDHRGPEFAELGREVLDRTEDRVPDRVAGRDLPGVGQRRVGSVARQHALARRRGAGVRHRRVLEELGRGGAAARPRTSRSCPAPGGAASIPTRSASGSPRDRDHRDQGACSSSTTKPRPASRAACPKSGARWTTRGIRRCCSWTRSRRSARSICATTSGGSTSRSRDRRRG